MGTDFHATETKARMAQALKEQLKTKSFSKITIGDIISSCEINRNTFYYHFENIYDLLYWTYEQEIQNIVNSFQKANAQISQAMVFIFSYIDENITLCQTALESLGEQELKNMYERDLKNFLIHTIDFICESKNISISEDFKIFLSFNFTGMLSNQIAWYIKYNKELDRAKFHDYIQTVLFSSLENSITAGSLKAF